MKALPSLFIMSQLDLGIHHVLSVLGEGIQDLGPKVLWILD